MKLPMAVIEKIVAKAEPVSRGSIEIILDETKPFVDIITHNRERIETAALPAGIAAIERNKPRK
jgi:hypothetical protein